MKNIVQFNKIENLEEIYKLSLKERRQKVMNELKKEALKFEELVLLLFFDNTNENLLYRYILSFNENDIYNELEKFSYFISLLKIKDLQNKLLGNHNQRFRNVTNKEFFFQFLSAIKEGNETSINQKLSVINIARNAMVTNNQPFDINFNLEAFYYHISCLLVAKIEGKKKRDKTIFINYLNGLKRYLCLLSDELSEYAINQYKEKEDIKKILTIIVIHLDKCASQASLTEVLKISPICIRDIISFDYLEEYY